MNKLNYISKFNYSHFYLIAILPLLLACEKEIELELPAAEPKIVIEGFIEQGKSPLVLVTRTQGFFEETSIESIQEMYVSDAEVYVNEQPLNRICSSEIPEELLPLVSELLGLPIESISNLNICAYIGLEITGEIGQTYDLRVEADGKTLTSTTKIPQPVQLDSSWFRLWANETELGYAFANLTDPDTLGNAYRWQAKRINQDEFGNQKDPFFVAPLGSTFEDAFFNGTTIEFGFIRGIPPNSTASEDLNEERGFYKSGDTIVVRFSSVPMATYEFYRTFESQIGSNGSPFSSPTNIISNINNGLGIWTGYGSSYDTLIAMP